MQKLKKGNGFSLLEILIIIALISLIAFGGFYFSKEKEARNGEIKAPSNDLERLKVLEKAREDVGVINKRVERENDVIDGN